jgi:hypothetical protein
MGAVASYVGHVDYLVAPYRGGGPWAALWVSWRTLWPWPGSPSSLRAPGALTGVMARRTGRVGLVKVSPKVNRGRRQYLNRARKASQRQARERARRAVGLP